MDGGRQMETVEISEHWGDILDENPDWFEDLCDELNIADPVAVWSQIETWMGTNQDTGKALPSDVLPAYKNTAALKSFLNTVVSAAAQVLHQPVEEEKSPLYMRLEGSEAYKKIYGINPEVAPGLLIFAATRKTGKGLTERLEAEVGRWGVHNFQADSDNYFYRKNSKNFNQRVARSNSIFKTGTEQEIQFSQYELLIRRSLVHIGQLLIARRNFDYEPSKEAFENRVPNSLTLQNYATCAAQLQTFCPETYAYCKILIEQAGKTEDLPLNALYFLGTVMRVLYPSINTADKINDVSPDGREVSLQERLTLTLVKERLNSSRPPRTRHEANQALWQKIENLRIENQSPEAIFETLSFEEKNMIANEKIRGLARSCKVEPASEDLFRQ